MMKGRREHANRLRKLASEDVVRMAGKAVYVGSDMIRAEAHHSISAGSVSGKGHVASKPGEPPNRDTGDLQAGLTNDRVSPLVAEVKSSAPHARPLEFGTSKMGARPYMRPARDKMKPKVEKMFRDELGKLMQRSGK